MCGRSEFINMEQLNKHFQSLCAAAMGLCLLVVGFGAGVAATPEPRQLAALAGVAALAAGSVSAERRRQAQALRQSALAPEGAATFDDIVGCEEAVEEMRQLACFLRDPQRFERAGARLPRGVLLYGPPGTGKTLMARALAGEAGVAFLHANGSDFVQMYVGVGAKRVRELFRRAREYESCVVFIDEIDALGKRRGGGEENAEREQTLNALLSELCGFQPSKSFLVVAATNRPEVLDEALTRPGRFDRRIELGLPDRSARQRILSHHLKRAGADCGPGELPSLTAGFSGAGLESLVNEAAMQAAMEGCGIQERHLQAAFVESLAGKTRRGAKPDEKTQRRVALHEAGHALACLRFLPEEPILLVSVLPSTRGAGGYVLRRPSEGLPTRHSLRGAIRVALAGRAAEEIVFGGEEVSAGAANDLRAAESLVRRLVYEYGLEPELGLMPGRKADEEALCAILDREYACALGLLSRERDRLERLAKALLEQEQMDLQAVLAAI